MSRSVIASIRQDDEGYRPLPDSIEFDPLFKLAESYIYSDGMFGPYSLRDIFREAGPRERGLTLTQAKALLRDETPRDTMLDVLRNAADEISDYVSEDYETCDDGACTVCAVDGGHLVEVSRVDSREIIRDRFSYVYEIYGRGIL